MRSLRLLLMGAALPFLVLLAPAGPAQAVQVTEFPLPVAGSSPLGIALGAGRQPLVHRGLGEPVRPHHPRGGRHRLLHRIGHQRRRGAVGHRRRGRRRPLVHRAGGQPGRAHQPADGARPPSSPRASPPPSGPRGITAGPDGNIWFAEDGGNRIGRITPAGVVTEFSAGITPGQPAPRDHRRPGRQPLVHRAAAAGIGRITPAGVGHRVLRRASRPAASPRGSPPAPTATSGSPSSPEPDRADHPGGRGHRVPRSPPGPSPGASSPAPTATCGSPRRTAGASARITPAGVVTEYPLTLAAGGAPTRDHGRSRARPLVHDRRRQPHRAGAAGPGGDHRRIERDLDRPGDPGRDGRPLRLLHELRLRVREDHGLRVGHGVAHRPAG